MRSARWINSLMISGLTWRHAEVPMNTVTIDVSSIDAAKQRTQAAFRGVPLCNMPQPNHVFSLYATCV